VRKSEGFLKNGIPAVVEFGRQMDDKTEVNFEALENGAQRSLQLVNQSANTQQKCRSICSITAMHVNLIFNFFY
jgi:hypothetical protein